MVNQKSTKVQKQVGNRKTLQNKINQKVSAILRLAEKMYPNRYTRLEPKPNCIQGTDINEHIYELWTCPKESELPAEGWQLIQRGLLDTVRRYCQHELSNSYIRHDSVADVSGESI